MHIELQGFYCRDCRKFIMMDSETIKERQYTNYHYLCDECYQKEQLKGKMNDEKGKENITQNS